LFASLGLRDVAERCRRFWRNSHINLSIVILIKYLIINQMLKYIRTKTLEFKDSVKKTTAF
jgi:hypothetical protein